MHLKPKILDVMLWVMALSIWYGRKHFIMILRQFSISTYNSALHKTRTKYCLSIAASTACTMNMVRSGNQHVLLGIYQKRFFILPSLVLSLD